jgi:inorganic triphosphatase YgiF
MASPPGREFELKLELTASQLRRVNHHPRLDALTVGQPVTRTLRSIYFDTPDFRLQAAGISLRARHDGDGWQQTVKSGTRVSNGVSHPVEVETVLPGLQPDLGAIADRQLRQALLRLTRDSLLEAVFETVVTRTLRRLHTGDVDLELALDEGIVRAGAEENPLCEAELELKAGTADSLLRVAVELFGDEPVVLAGSSKAERGYNLLLGRSAASRRPQHADQLTVPRHATCGMALTQFFESAVRQIVDNRRVVLETDEPEGAHQLRVGLRRLRSVLKAFRPLHDTALTRDLDRRACDVARAVGALRDADVLIEATYPAAAVTLARHPGVEPLKSALLAHRRDQRHHARAILSNQHWSALQLYLALWPRTIAENRALDEPLARFADRALSKAWKRATKKGRHLASLGGEERHELRKALKALRYTIEFFGTLYRSGQVEPLLKALKKLQDVFGYLNDVEAARRLESISEVRCPSKGDAQRVAGYIIGWHTAKAATCCDGVEPKWRRLMSKPRFWC